MTIACMTYLSPVWRVAVDVLLSFLFIVLFFYLPLRLKTRRSGRIVLFVLGGMLLLLTQWVIIEDYQCNQSFQPELIYDLNQPVTTREQAVEILQNYILENYFSTYNPNSKNRTGQPLMIEEYLNAKEERKEKIKSDVVQEGNTYSVYYFTWRFTFHENGKLYRKWAGD
ncbi:MAG: hypothetical protein AABX37_02585 [Nanoarchaeota archaeon]|mgnify:CR=1 FL=1